MFESQLDSQAIQGNTPSAAFCVTLYNEHGENLAQTICSVVDGIKYCSASKEGGNENVYICIIVDGVNNAHDSTLQWLREKELLSSPYSLEIERCATYYYEDDISGVVSKFGSVKATEECITSVGKIGFLVILKELNRGKLHSHSLFFSEICERLGPTYCFQLDVGTIVDVKAYHQICREMDNRRDIGAIAPCISTKHPNQQGCAVAMWQHMDFVVQKTVGWPSEVATGHLSVIPGQFCVIRWEALRSKDLTGQPTAIDLSDQPIARYLRGVEGLGAIQRIMYLAEDRVMGNEIVLQDGPRWRLEYDSSSKATTDACPTIMELLRQRRRWNNSSMVCRVHFIARLPQVLKQESRSFGSKLSFMISSIYQAILLLIDFFIPAIQFSFFYTLYKSILIANSLMKEATLFSLVLFLIVTLVVEINLHPNLTERRRRAQDGALKLSAAVASTASVFAVSKFLPTPYMALIYAPILMFLAACIIVFGSKFARIFIMYPYYMIINSFISPLISFYSMLRFDRVSWGTKGLVSEEESIISKRLKRLRNIVFSSWLLANVSIIGLSIAVESTFEWPVNPIFVAAATIMSVISLISVVTLSLKLKFQKAYN